MVGNIYFSLFLEKGTQISQLHCWYKREPISRFILLRSMSDYSMKEDERFREIYLSINLTPNHQLAFVSLNTMHQTHFAHSFRNQIWSKIFMKFEDSFLKTSFPRFVSNIALGVDLSIHWEKQFTYIYKR